MLIPLLQQKVNRIVSAEGLGHDVLLEPSFLKSFRSGSKYVFGLRFGAVGLDACLKFLDTVKVNGMSVSFVGDDNSVWVSFSEASETPYDVYCSVANWANGHGVDVLSEDSRSFLQRKVDGKGNASTSFIPMVDVGISDAKIDTSQLVSDVLVYVGLLGVKGLVKNEEHIKALINVLLWRLYLAWYNRNKFRSRVSKVLRNMGMSEQADNFYRCGEHVYNMACVQCGYVHAVTFHCKLRICPECGWGRKRALTASYSDALRSLGRLRFITLTLKNVANLGDGVKRIRACFRKLRHRKGYKVWIKGGLYGIESPVGRDGLWNVHLHVLYAGCYIDQGRLANDWEAITGDSRCVFIQDVRHGRSPIGYILKYVNKHDSILSANDDKLGEYISVLRNVRLLQPFGCLLGMKAEKGLFLCPECGGCVWQIEGMDDGLVGLNSGRRYRRYSDHDEYLATMYKQ